MLAPRSPSVFSRPPTVRPGVSAGTAKALRPLAPAAGSVAANTTKTPAMPPLLTHVLAPFSTYASPWRTARVRSRVGSLPAPASVSANAPMRSPAAISGSRLSLTAALPCSRIVRDASVLCT